MCKNVLWLITERMAPVCCSCFFYDVSCIMPFVSCLLYHVSCLTSHVPHLLSHVSCLTFPVPRLLSQNSYLNSPVLRLLSPVSRLLSQVFCLTSPVSRLLRVVSFFINKSFTESVAHSVRSVAGGHGFKPWMVFIFPKSVKNTKIVRN